MGEARARPRSLPGGQRAGSSLGGPRGGRQGGRVQKSRRRAAHPAQRGPPGRGRGGGEGIDGLSLWTAGPTAPRLPLRLPPAPAPGAHGPHAGVLSRSQRPRAPCSRQRRDPGGARASQRRPPPGRTPRASPAGGPAARGRVCISRGARQGAAEPGPARRATRRPPAGRQARRLTWCPSSCQKRVRIRRRPSAELLADAGRVF